MQISAIKRNRRSVRELPRENAIALLRRGLVDEYRVRMAKLAAIEFQVSTFRPSDTIKRVRPNDYMPSELTRLALTPAQLYDYYSDNRTELRTRSLLAIPSESFVDQVGEADANTQPEARCSTRTLFAKADRRRSRTI